MEIVRLTEASEGALKDLNNLIVQLRRDGATSQGTLEDLQKVMADKSAIMLVIKDGEKIIGMGTLYKMIKLGRYGGSAEDVVVDGAYRGQGLGRKLMDAMIETARSEGLQSIYLTSRPDPDRVAANKLYTGAGFERVDTNLYKLSLQ